MPVNTFAADLSPILRRYFSSQHQENIREIVERAYVASDEITEYDKVLESLLQDRLAVRRGTVVQPLKPDKRGESRISEAISRFEQDRPESGQLQIVQGAVGSGKSLFMQRYQLVGSGNADNSLRWSFVDFNTSPVDLSHGEEWLCAAFNENFEINNPGIDVSDPKTLRGMFSRNLQRRRSYYEAVPTDQAEIEKAKDLTTWLADPKETARGIAQYILGSRHEVLVVVMDNVDRLDLHNQLNAFQLTLWFMQQTRSFVILQMRDETYERFKDRPPLDTFRTGINFHISPPRFIDVVKRRLELSLEYLAANAQKTQRYTIESGIRVAYPSTTLADFLKLLYSEIFDRKRNVSRILEALAGWDVRRALDMFISIITSGHLDEALITSNLITGERSAKGKGVSERLVLRILMRTDYRFFSDHSGLISNIFAANPDWKKPDNFLLVELLYYLAINRKRVGQIGLQGYFTCEAIAREVQRYGYLFDDVLAGLNVLLQRRLIGADHMNFNQVEADDSVRIHASGFMHLRILSGRIEYIHGVLPTTPIFEREFALHVAEFVKQESVRTSIGSFQKAREVELFYEYLARQRDQNTTPFSTSDRTGAAYVLKQISTALQHFKRESVIPETDLDPLDF